MKVLVTGSKGFIGKNLLSRLTAMNIEVLEFDRNDSSVLFELIERADAIVHLAGENRPKDIEDFYTVNSGLTSLIIDKLNEYKKEIPLIFSSSIQAELNNDYGQSKRDAEDYIKSNYSNYYIYRLTNVFGKWCRPNYNSVVATFCSAIANDEEISISDVNKRLDLVYVDDVCEDFISVLNNKNVREVGQFLTVEPSYNVSLGEIVDLLQDFKRNINQIKVPETGNDFIKKLYSTFISYVQKEDLAFKLDKKTDDRGYFVELLRTESSGQFSLSYSKPGIVRGNHYHHTKIERFIVIKGEAVIRFKSILDENDKFSINVSDRDMKIVTIPVGYTHSIENTGNDEMLLGIWCNEVFDEKKPDTIFLDSN